MRKPNELLEKLILNSEIAGAGLIVRRNGHEEIRFVDGYSDVASQKKTTIDTVYHLASMTKPITAIAAMQLVEKGQLSVMDPIDKYLPEFGEMLVSDRLIGFGDCYNADPDNPMMAVMIQDEMNKVKMIKAKNKILIRDLLNHSSGLGMGVVSNEAVMNCFGEDDNLRERVEKFAETPLDFEPGTMTGYSAVVAFDVLGRIIEIISGDDLDTYFKKFIFNPMGIKDMGFIMDASQRTRLSCIYKKVDDEMIEDESADSFIRMLDASINGYYSGAGGLFGTLAEYDKIVQMLLNRGVYEEVRIIGQETLELMVQESATHSKELMPGVVWGLGMAVFGNEEETKRSVSKGSYGWSGAFGTHFYVDPLNNIGATLVLQRSDLGGADSYISRELEASIYETFIVKAT